MNKALIILDKNEPVRQAVKQVLELFEYEGYTVIEASPKMVFRPKEEVDEYIILVDPDEDSTETENDCFLNTIFLRILKEYDNKPFRFIESPLQDIVPLLQKITQEDDQLSDAGRKARQLEQEQLCDRELADQLTGIIRKQHEAEHAESITDFASKTELTRSVFYHLAWRFQDRHPLRFLILDDKKDVLEDAFKGMKVTTKTVRVSEKPDLVSDTAFAYFLDFDDFNTCLTNKNLNVHEEEWGKAVRDIFKKLCSIQSDERFVFDGIVLDIYLGKEYNGIDILHALKNDDKQFDHVPKKGLDNIPIIMLTGLSDEWHIIESVEKHADWYLSKYKYGDQLTETLKEIPVTFYRFYLRRQELQQLSIDLFEFICDIDLKENGTNHKLLECRLECIQKSIQNLRRKNIPSFLSAFFQSLAEISIHCQSILTPGLAFEDWVEVKSAGESILDELDKITPFNDLYCFNSGDAAEKYLGDRKLGRDKVRLPFIKSEERRLNVNDERPSWLSEHFRKKVIDIIRFARQGIHSLRPQKPQGII